MLFVTKFKVLESSLPIIYILETWKLRYMIRTSRLQKICIKKLPTLKNTLWNQQENEDKEEREWECTCKPY